MRGSGDRAECSHKSPPERAPATTTASGRASLTRPGGPISPRPSSAMLPSPPLIESNYALSPPQRVRGKVVNHVSPRDHSGTNSGPGGPFFTAGPCLGRTPTPEHGDSNEKAQNHRTHLA